MEIVIRSLLGAAACLVTHAACAAPVPALALRGTGVQIYVCADSAAGVAWKLKAPEATLQDAAGHLVAHHFAGPSWQAADGSKVVGAVLSASPAPAAGSIPWLIVRATETTGAGIFAHVAYVLRTQTAGGAAPATGCDAGHVGAETRVAYSASYIFFTPAS